MILCPQVELHPSGHSVLIRGIGAEINLPPESARLMAQRLILCAERAEALMPSPAETGRSTTR